MQDLTPEDGQKFASQLLRVPRDYGKGLYRCMTPRQAVALRIVSNGKSPPLTATSS
ncbi:MAG: hypothetical protein H5U13_07365 [Parvibaculum sp.]|nr:hypothetical protein [Parvibaculum sp.]